MYRGANNIYYNYDASNPSALSPAVEMWICTETYFTWKRGAIIYIGQGIPDSYALKNLMNE